MKGERRVRGGEVKSELAGCWLVAYVASGGGSEVGLDGEAVEDGRWI